MHLCLQALSSNGGQCHARNIMDEYKTGSDLLKTLSNLGHWDKAVDGRVNTDRDLRLHLRVDDLPLDYVRMPMKIKRNGVMEVVRERIACLKITTVFTAMHRPASITRNN
jgi:hypothetical protein